MRQETPSGAAPRAAPAGTGRLTSQDPSSAAAAVALTSEGPAGSCPARTRAITETVCDPSTLLGTAGQSLVLVRCRTDPRSTENEKPRVVLDLSGAGVAVRLGVADAVRRGVADAPAVADGEAPGVGDAATSVNIATATPASASANGNLDFKIAPPLGRRPTPQGARRFSTGILPHGNGRDVVVEHRRVSPPTIADRADPSAD